VCPWRRAGTAEKTVVSPVFRQDLGRIHELLFHLYNLCHRCVLWHMGQVLVLGIGIVENPQGLDVAHVQIGREVVVYERALHFSRVLQFLGMGPQLV